MTARTVIEHALRVYFADSRDPQGIVDKLLAQYDAEHRVDVLREAVGIADRNAQSQFKYGENERGHGARGVEHSLRIAVGRAVKASEKSIPSGSQPREDVATHEPTQAGGEQ
jgi:hypothetical protein